MKDFQAETATAGPKLVTEIKEDPNSTKAINKQLKKQFKLNKKKRGKGVGIEKQKSVVETKVQTDDIKFQTFGIQRSYNEEDAMAEVKGKKVAMDGFYKMMAIKQQKEEGVTFLS